MTEQHPANDWQSCDAGSIQTLTNSLRATTRQKTIQRRAVLGMGVTAVVGVGFGIFQLSGTNAANGGLTCQQVRPMLQDFIAMQVEPEMRTRIESHLGHCEMCSVELRRLQGSATATS